MYQQQILSKIPEYLKKKKYPHKKYGKLIIILCPFCKENSLTARIIPHTSKMKCLNPKCNKKFTLASIVREHEKKFKNQSKENIVYYLKDLLNINVLTKKDEKEIQEWFDFFEQNGFSLVPIVKNGKAPIEKNWTQKEHKIKEDWIRWVLVDGLNVGVRTGIVSNITVIDIDQKEIPEEIKPIIGETLIQETKKGYHLFYKYEQDLPKSRIDEFKIDIENEGGQVVIYPSITDDFKREFKNKNKILKMPEKLKELLKSKIRLPKRTFSEQITTDIETDDYRKPLIEEGEGRNDLFIRLAGKFRKFLNLNQTESIIRILNRVVCDPPLAYREIKAMMNSLERYTIFDEEELAQEVLNYLKEAESAKRGEIVIALNEENKRVTKVLNYLVKEGYVLKRGSIYFIIKKVEWKTALIDEGKPVNFKVPYFYDRAVFNDKDMILIGARTKRGKTHMAINIVQQLVEQGIPPHYLSLETGSRFAKIALQLGLKEGDFKHAFCADPTKIELERDTVTIIDWLLPDNYAEVDKIFKHFAEQLDKYRGFLIVFMQLKDNGDWFAPNLVRLFPALAVKYIYDDETDGTYGRFDITEVREPLARGKQFTIPCKYDWESKKLIRVEDELNEENKEENKNEETKDSST
jgi:hypothetical protein